MINNIHSLLGLELPEPHEASFVIWTPTQNTPGMHSYYFSEDLFAHELAGDFSYPGLDVDGGLLYKRTPVSKSSLCSDLRNYWSRWVGEGSRWYLEH